MDAAPPRIAVVPAAVMYGCFGLFMLWLALSRPPDLAFDLLCFFLLALCLALVPPLSTQLTSSGVSQLSVVGRRHLAWADVREIKAQRQSIALIGANSSMRLPLIFFSNPEAVAAYVAEHLPLSLRGRF